LPQVERGLRTRWLGGLHKNKKPRFSARLGIKTAKRYFVAAA
jgi:hypothetical protein